jgi:hypothetical protein
MDNSNEFTSKLLDNIHIFYEIYEECGNKVHIYLMDKHINIVI